MLPHALARSELRLPGHGNVTRSSGGAAGKLSAAAAIVAMRRATCSLKPPSSNAAGCTSITPTKVLLG